ncbi:MAG TPA: hypothetical protein VGA72_14590, partial [Anaerolineales bacterium]
GIDYWPATGNFLINDSEVEESVGGNPPVYWHGYNVFLSTPAGDLAGNCTTFTAAPISLAYNNFSNEPTGVAINPNNNHIFFSNDGSNSRVFEVGMGTDNVYCTSDDTVTRTFVATLYGATDAEDVAYGNNTVFIADGINAEVYSIPLGANGILGGGDDGPVTHFDTAALGFSDLEGIGFNQDSGTLFIVSTTPTNRYLGETTTTGTLLRAYDLSLMGSDGNLRSDVTYAPSSQNPAVKNIYIASRGVDNDNDRDENDGRIWEISLGSTPVIDTPTPTPTMTAPPDAGTWHIYGQGAYVFGTSGDVPVEADYNGDGTAEIAVFRPSNGNWYIAGSASSYVFGGIGDIPVVADYNGDGTADVAVFRPSNGNWYIVGSASSYVFGGSGDIPVVADYNADGRNDIAIFRPSNSTWYIAGVGTFVWGGSGDIPVVADYNGDGMVDIAVFRP